MKVVGEQVPFSLRLPKALHERVALLAQENHRSLNQEIVVALERHTQVSIIAASADGTLNQQNGTTGRN